MKAKSLESGTTGNVLRSYDEDVRSPEPVLSSSMNEEFMMKLHACLKQGFSALFFPILFGILISSPLSAQVNLPDSFPGGFKLTRPVADYNPQNLYELIDGQAVFYLSYGFVILHHAFYKVGNNTYKVDVYQVADVLSALGCFREQRDETASPLAVGTEGYQLDYLTAFYKDARYVEIVPENVGTEPEMTALAQRLETLLPGSRELPRELGMFPPDGLIEGSQTYFGADLLSYSFLGRGLSANYHQNGTDHELRVFVALGKDAPDALNMQKEFSARLSDTSNTTLTGGIPGVIGTLPYRGESMLFAGGRFAFGCIGVTDRKQALGILEQFRANLAGFDRQQGVK